MSGNKEIAYMIELTNADKLVAVQRELRLRRAAYPKWVGAGRMTQVEADREILIFEAIAADYFKLTEKERLL